jgi:phosphatidate phosphatase PAH1
MKKAKEIYTGIKESLNPGKKSSAIMDVIVVQQLDGSLKSTPFFVQFGIGKLADTSGRLVDIYHRGQPTHIVMRLDRNGVARFDRSQSNLKKEADENPEAIESKETEKIEGKEEEKYSVIEKSSDPSLPPESEENLNKSAEIPSSSLDLDRNSEKSNESFNSSPEEFKESPNNLSSEELKRLGLISEMNVVDFVVRDWPEIYLRGKIYLWPQDSRIIISDIDGTLTKSDLMGHICQLFGTDWTRGGVVSFYNNLHEKGYRILYLTARSLGQVDTTREYLMQIKQQGAWLPDGPLFLNPVGMVTALVSELSKKSKDFKIRALLELKGLFHDNPFHSGIGNRLGDSISYSHVGIDKNLIFIIDKKGKEKGDHVTIKDFNELNQNIDVNFPRLTN